MSPAFRPFASQYATKTTFEVKFCLNRQFSFVYRSVVNQNQILEEELKEINKTQSRATGKLIFKRKWVNKTKKYEYKFYNRDNNRFFFKLLDPTSTNWQPKKNVSIIASLNEMTDQPNIIKDIYEYWSDILISINPEQRKRMVIRRLSKMFRGVPEQKNPFFAEISEHLKQLDVGFHAFYKSVEISPDAMKEAFKEVKQAENKKHLKDKLMRMILGKFGSTSFGFKHKFKKTPEFDLQLSQESSGTLMLVSMFIDIIETLNNPKGSSLIIDEMDAYLHPDIVEYIVNLFKSPDTNPNRSQLLFSSHCHSLLNELDKQQIILTEKDGETGATEVWRLDNVEGLKTDSNYYRKYIAGALGAKPRIF